MKRLSIGILLLCLTVCFPIYPAHAISLEFVPPAQTVSLGNTASIAINISGLGNLTAPSLGTYDIDVNFNPTILSFNSVAFGDPVLGDQLDLFGLGSLTVVTAGVGTVNLFELSFDDTTDLNNLQAGAFTLATLKFNTIGSGNSALSMSVNALGDAVGNSLAADVQNGSVTVTRISATPEPPTMVLFALGLLLLVLNAKNFLGNFPGGEP